MFLKSEVNFCFELMGFSFPIFHWSYTHIFIMYCSDNYFKKYNNELKYSISQFEKSASSSLSFGFMF